MTKKFIIKIHTPHLAFELSPVDSQLTYTLQSEKNVSFSSISSGDSLFTFDENNGIQILFDIYNAREHTLILKKTHHLVGISVTALQNDFPTLFEKLTLNDVHALIELEDSEFDLLLQAFLGTTMDTTSASIIHASAPSIPLPHNRIIYGAPGTGKSYLLKEQMAGKRFDGANTTNPTPLFAETNYERVTFYPNYTYGQFFGTYKPKKAYKNMDPYITYEFVPGPFFRLLLRALESKQQGQPENFLLIIEEINRANAAAVFGDVFQLLDRNDDGESEYGIKLSEDALQFISENHTGLLSNDELKIPDNFYIWTTMNNADQGVQPLDSAFKRRFDFEYIGINDNEAAIQSIPVQLPGFSGPIDWNSFRKTLNKFLLQSFSHIKEDKLIGPFFIKKSVLDSAKFDDAFKNKLLMYLSDDVLKTADKTKLFKVSSFSELIELHRKNEQLFSDEFYTELVNEITLTPQRSQPDDRFTPDTEEDE